MPIRGPKGAHPTLRGWVNPRTGELLKSQRINQTQIDEFFGIKEEVKPKATAQVLTEAPRNNESLDDMSKVELEALGRQHGIDDHCAGGNVFHHGRAQHVCSRCDPSRGGKYLR